MKDQYFVFNGSDVAFFGEINNDIFDAQAEDRVSLKRLSFEFLFTTNGHKIVSVNVAGVMLQIIDADDTERYYNKIIPIEWEQMGSSPTLFVATMSISMPCSNIFKG